MDRTELIAQAKAIAESRITDAMDADEKMDVLETAMIQLLDIQIMKPPVGRVGTIAAGGGQPSTGHWLMGDDPRLPKMPEHPTLMDFFRLRFQQDTYGSNHLLQSARLARDKGLPGHLVLACLLHDISVIGFIRTDHGHWAAQMIEPYVTEEATWAVRHHQALRFRPASDYDFDYPALYTRVFGDDYDPRLYQGRMGLLPDPQMVRFSHANCCQRSLCLRSGQGGTDRGVRRHHRRTLPPARRRPRFRP